MTGLLSLVLPILLSAVAVFIVSSIIHMLSPWHKGDYPKMPDEEKFRDAVRPLGIPPGDYMVPRAGSMADYGSPEFKAKVEKGPVVIMTVLPNKLANMTKSLGLWFLYSLVVSLLAAYVAGAALPHGAPFLAVFRFAGAVSFIGYSVALWQMTIWYNRSWWINLKSTIDGLIYALVTAAVFGWLWPAL